MSVVSESGDSVIFKGSYRHAGSFAADGSPLPATGTVMATPQGRSTSTATLDGTGSYQITLAPFAGQVTVVESLTDVAPATTRYTVVHGTTVDTSRDIFVGGSHSPELAVIDGGTP